MPLRKFVLGLLIILSIMIFQPTASAGEPSEGVIYRVEKTHIVQNNSSNDAMDVAVRIYLMDNHSGWASQQILSEDVTVDDSLRGPPPLGNEDNRSMWIQLGDIDAGNARTISTSQVIKVDAINFQIDPGETIKDIPAQYRDYTAAVDHLWQSDDPRIENKALELASGENSYYYKALRILEFVENYLFYQVQEDEHDAIWAYERKKGDCSGYSNLFIALTRAAGIPAKAVSGYLLTQPYSSESIDLSSAGHQWAIIYLPSVGWVPVDLTYSMPQGLYGELSNEHIIELTSDGSNWVSGTDIRIPSSFVSYKYTGPDPGITLETSGTITRVVAIESSVHISSETTDGVWRFTVEAKNVGTQSLSDVKVRLEVDNTYFETQQPKNLGDLNPDIQTSAYFDVSVKKSVENSPVTAVLSYDAGEYGPFVSRKVVSVTAHLAQPSYELPISLNMAIILMMLLAGITIGAIAFLRR